MNDYRYVVTVTVDTEVHAIEVLQERLMYDDDESPYEYCLNYEAVDGPQSGDLIAKAYEVLERADVWAEYDDVSDQSDLSHAGAALHDTAGAFALAVLSANGVDTTASASRQHYIDTGRYLLKGES